MTTQDLLIGVKMDLLLEAVNKIEEATRAIKRISLSNLDPSLKFNQKTLVKEKFRDMSQSEALVSILGEHSGCMNINDIANDLFEMHKLSPEERIRHMKALQSIIKRTSGVVKATSSRGYWKLDNV